MTGSGVKTILFYKALTRNLEIGNALVLNFPNTWRLGQVRDSKHGMNVSNAAKKLLQSFRVTAVTVSVLLRKN